MGQKIREYRSYLEKKIEKYPELFPLGIKEGFRLHGFVTSRRQQLSEKAEEAEKALYLRKYGLSYEEIAHILGHSGSLKQLIQ